MATPSEPAPMPRPTQGALVIGALVGVIALVILIAASDSPPKVADVEPVGQLTSDLDFGTYTVAPDAVTDGDTLRVPQRGSVRVIGIDCEELFKTDQERESATRDFAVYAAERRGDSALPVKYGTPAGEAARDAARELIGAAGRVRLEKDDTAASDRDGFGRTLAHVVLLTAEGESLLAEALIEQGHSPYFVKYGRSLRYDRRLARAERRAQVHRRGIWSATGPDHYPDYDERLAWWHERADQVDRWRARADSPADVALEQADAEERLRARIDEQTTVFGVLRARRETGSPRILWLRHLPRRDFAAVVFNVELWDSLDHAALDRGFVTVTGPITLYRDRPQILVEHATQIGMP